MCGKARQPEAFNTPYLQALDYICNLYTKIETL